MLKLASLKLTLAMLPLLGAGVLTSYYLDAWRTEAMLVPLALLSVNLLAAVATHPAFRRNLPLLTFHLALLAIIVLIGLGRLSYLTGEVEVAEGELFDAAAMQNVTRGPWHPEGLRGFTFTNRGFIVDYAPGVRRTRTANLVAWRDSHGQTGTSIVGDDTPLVLDGYRFYTTSNKGFAPAFLWQPARGTPVAGSVHLPSYPVHEHGQARDWQLPGSDTRAWVMLQLDGSLIDPEKASRLRLPERHALVLRVGEVRHELQPGGSVELAEGTLTYTGLHTWMGYSVFYDWTTPWLLAACFLAVLTIGWHYWRSFAAKPWDDSEGRAARIAPGSRKPAARSAASISSGLCALSKSP